MFTSYRRSAARLAAAGIATGLLAAGAFAGAASAVADEAATPSSSGATAVLDGIQSDLSDVATVATKDGRTNSREAAGLFKMDLGGGKSIYTYCIDLFNSTKPKAHYQEVPWSATSLYQQGKDRAKAGKIAWILNHSFPQVDDLGALAKTAGAGPLSKKTAAAGTQVAIWRLSDDPTAKANDPAAEQLADYLSKTAVAVAEPDASLTLDPPSVSGKSGDRIGPVTVHTNADSAAAEIAANAAGVKLVDADGKPVTTAKDGSKLYFDVPAGAEDGSTTVKVTATTTVPIGRAFTGFGADDSASQTQILAGSDTTPLTAQAAVTWAKKGPIPAVSAAVDCAKGGIDVTAANKGDEDLTFSLGGKDHTVAPGASQTVLVPVAEDQHYRIDVTLPDKSVKSFEGVLDCKSATTAPTTPATTPANQPSPAGSSQDLAATGSSNATPMIAGIAIALVVLGGGAVFFFRRKKNATGAE